jgi:hypothetical protein
MIQFDFWGSALATTAQMLAAHKTQRQAATDQVTAQAKTIGEKHATE